VIWGWATVWIFLAFSGLVINLRHGKVPFNLGWWAFTFPLGKISSLGLRDLILGTFGLASGLLGEKCDNTFFKVVSVVDTIVVLLFWFIVAFNCLVGAIDGSLFFEDGPSRGEEKARKGDGSQSTPSKCKRTSSSNSNTMSPSDV